MREDGWLGTDIFSGYIQSMQQFTDLFLQRDEMLATQTMQSLQAWEPQEFDDSQILGGMERLISVVAANGAGSGASSMPLGISIGSIIKIIEVLANVFSVLGGAQGLFGGTGEASFYEKTTDYSNINTLIGNVIGPDSEVSIDDIITQLSGLSAMAQLDYTQTAQAVLKLMESTDAFASMTETGNFATNLFLLANRYGLDFLDVMDQLAIAMYDGVLAAEEMETIFGSAPAVFKWLQGTTGYDHIDALENGSNISAEAFSYGILNAAEERIDILRQAPVDYDLTDTLDQAILPYADTFFSPIEVFLNVLAEEISAGDMGLFDFFSTIKYSIMTLLMIEAVRFFDMISSSLGLNMGSGVEMEPMSFSTSPNAFMQTTGISDFRSDLYGFLSGMFSFVGVLQSIQSFVVDNIVNPLIGLVNTGISLVNRLFKTDISPLQQVQGNEEAMAPMQWFAQYFADKAMQSESAYQEALLAAQTSGSVTAAPQVLFENLLQSGAMVDPVVLENTADGVFSLVDVGNIGNGLSSKHWDAEQRERQLYVSDEQVYRLQLLDAVNTASAEENQPVQLTVNATANIYKDSDADSFVESLIDQMMAALSGRSSR